MKYYKTDSRKISYREYWQVSPKSFLLAWRNKFLGRQMNLTRGIPEPQPFQSRIIEPATMPSEILERLNSGVRDLQAAGFDQFWYYSSNLSLTGVVSYGATGLHLSRQILAHVIYVAYKARERAVLAMVSGFQDGLVLGTANKKRKFDPPPKYFAQRKLGAGAPELLALHQSKMAELSRNNPALVFSGLEAVAAFQDEILQRIYADKISRGIWVEMTEEEVAALRAKKPVAHMVLPPD